MIDSDHVYFPTAPSTALTLSIPDAVQSGLSTFIPDPHIVSTSSSTGQVQWLVQVSNKVGDESERHVPLRACAVSELSGVIDEPGEYIVLIGETLLAIGACLWRFIVDRIDVVQVSGPGHAPFGSIWPAGESGKVAVCVRRAFAWVRGGVGGEGGQDCAEVGAYGWV